MKTNERVSKKEVNIYIIKDGNSLKKESKFENNNQISTDELRLLKLTYNEKCSENLENIYKILSDNGYTVIRLTNRYSQIFLGYTIKKSDKEIILEFIDDIIKNKKIEIYNRVKTSYGKDYEVMYINDKISAKIAIEILLDEKTNELDEREKQILNNYRNFDLKKLLLYKNNEVINNLNSGVMIITNKELICSTLKKKDCNEQISSILENLYYKEDINKQNIITIQIQSDKKIVIDIPEDINEFQHKTLTNSIKLIKNARVRGTKFIVNGTEIKIEEIEKDLKQKKCVENIKNIKYKKQNKVKKIGNIEIKSILKIKDYDNRIGQKVKQELEEYALDGLVIKGNVENKIIVNKIKNAEVYEIISKIEDEYIKKIPIEILQSIKNKKTKFIYNTRKKLANQNVQEDTIKILSYINLNYWCNRQEREELQEIYKRNEEKSFNNILDIEKNNSLAVIKPQNWLTKIISSIKKILVNKQEIYIK